MSRREKDQVKRSGEVWVLVQHREGNLDRETFGLLAEARRIISECKNFGTLTAVALGPGLGPVLGTLNGYGADRVLYDDSSYLDHFHGELFSEILNRMVWEYQPSCILMAQNSETSDLSARLAAMLETTLVSRAVDLVIDEEGHFIATRPTANGYLFERVAFHTRQCPIICFLPSVLGDPEPVDSREMEILTETHEIPLQNLRTNVVDVIEAEPEEMDIKEADIIVAGGRGAIQDNSFDIIHELARAIDGAVGGTRPVIDSQHLQFDRQIGQTGKTVIPQLMFACGISGANEFTAGMENSGLVIAINRDPNARIFRFSDLGIIGDLHEVIPRLIERLGKIRESS